MESNKDRNAVVDISKANTLAKGNQVLQSQIFLIMFISFLIDIGFGIGFPVFIGFYTKFFALEELLIISASILIIPLILYLILGLFYFNQSKLILQSILPPTNIDSFFTAFKRIKRTYYIFRIFFMSGTGILSYFILGVVFFVPILGITVMFKPVTVLSFIGSLTTGGILSITTVKLWFDYKFGQLLSEAIQKEGSDTFSPTRIKLTHSITQNTLWLQQFIIIGILIGISTAIIVEFGRITTNIIISLLVFVSLFTGFLIIQFYLVFKPLTTLQQQLFALIEKEEPWEQMPIITMNEIGLITYNYNLAIQEIEGALHAIEQRYRDLVNNVPIGLFRVNLEEPSFEVNPALIQILRGEITDGLSLQDLYNNISSDPIFQKEISRIAQSESQIRKFDMPIKRDDNSELFVRINVRVVTDSTGNKYYEGSLEDITEQKQMDVMRRELEEKRQLFISIINHEIRTPLTIIRGYNDLIQKHVEKLDKERRNEIFNTIKRHTERIEQLIREVTDVTQLQRGILQYEREDFNLCNFLAEILKPYSYLLQDQFEFNDYSSEKNVVIHGDKDRLQQVFDNILSNAIDNTSNEDRKIVVVSEIYNDLVKVIISDNGAGIAQENLEKIFEQFQTFDTKYSSKGTGIGLYIAKEIMKAHNGKLYAVSEGLDKGATFIMELPRKS
ncbi:MAG: ATP-binding protein [Candidatus Hodarchaeota archaeon]